MISLRLLWAAHLSFSIAHTFTKAGKYKMWVDVKPKGGIQVLTAFPFNVERQPVHTPATIVPNTTSLKKSGDR
jgi:hypothetical protein